ncbi:MAG: hypothetical protein GXW99_11700 [Clostridiales bacterium]|nr:hypothetical protein [Clostridiales bacterium]
MNKLFDLLEMDLSDRVIGELLRYIRSFSPLRTSAIPVEGQMGCCRFCASAQKDEEERPLGPITIHWVQVGRERIAVNATV